MLASRPIMAFVATQDPERAKPFYRDVLGLKLLSDEPFALVFDAHGTTLRVQKAGPFTPQPFTVLGWEVEDIRAALRALAGRGVVIDRYPQLQQDELGVWDAGPALIAWFKDPDGNTLSLAQTK